ncbi:MAG: hypothetical protein RLZZ591_116 [Pseudomonadota bacterium]|jgi:hypothetical protein
MSPEQKQKNANLAWILASIALVFLLGFVGKIILLNH